jgi:hypothetical protein
VSIGYRQDAVDGTAPEGVGSFLVFVEGPRDRDVLRSWARLLSPRLARRMVESTVILGGRQPARAVSHLQALGAGGSRSSGLCVLDRDERVAADLAAPEVNLELFTWQRRHIESYVLVPDAIRRGLRLQDRAVARRIADELPSPDDETALRSLDAKRLLARGGAVARAAGRPVDAGRVARAMRPDEIHPEVHGLLGRIAEGFGLRTGQPIVQVIATPSR